MSKNMTLDDLHNADLIDIRDVITRTEELQQAEERDREALDELIALEALLEELQGRGGDHQWQGDWYPVTLIRDSYFEDYARDLADDIGAVQHNAPWPMCWIDWERAAQELQQDYTSVDFDGTTYWYR